MASSITEGQIKKLRKAGYLSNDIAHRLPDEGQLIYAARGVNVKTLRLFIFL